MSNRPRLSRTARYNVADKKRSLQAARKVFKRRDTRHLRFQAEAYAGTRYDRYHPRRAYWNELELRRVKGDLGKLHAWDVEDAAIEAWFDE